MQKEEFISKIVYEFYKKATTDFLIGYQFRKIQDFEGSDPLSPPIEAFSSHLPRIEQFWCVQLLGHSLEGVEPFDLINIHLPLKVNKGEIHRWILLFKETLNENSNDSFKEFISLWNEKLDHFEKIFIRNLLGP